MQDIISIIFQNHEFTNFINAICYYLLRDENGRWIRGYTHKLGHCEVLKEDMSSILTGLELTWKCGFKQALVESDSQTLAGLVTNNSNCNEATLPKLVVKIRRTIAHNWRI